MRKRRSGEAHHGYAGRMLRRRVRGEDLNFAWSSQMMVGSDVWELRYIAAICWKWTKPGGVRIIIDTRTSPPGEQPRPPQPRHRTARQLAVTPTHYVAGDGAGNTRLEDAMTMTYTIDTRTSVDARDAPCARPSPRATATSRCRRRPVPVDPAATAGDPSRSSRTCDSSTADGSAACPGRRDPRSLRAAQRRLVARPSIRALR